MQERIRVAAVSLNQTPLDWDNNLKNIQLSINDAVKQGAQLVVTPELSITGYGCEDAFLTEGIDRMALQMISELDLPNNITVIVGLPLNIQGRLYNGAALISNDDGVETTIKGVYLKQNLAKNGIHYENRWFNAWPKGQMLYMDVAGDSVPVGDIIFEIDHVKFGFEICEDAWVAERPGRDLFGRGVDVIINPSASHFAIGKYHTREQFVKEGSRAFGAAYIYSNLNGCESGRAVFDGGNMIASGGEIIAKGDRLFYTDHSVIVADIDLWENKLSHQVSSQAVNHEIRLNAVSIDNIKWHEPKGIVEQKLSDHQAWQESKNLEHEEAARAIALGLYDWMRKTHTDGFTLSLSGGADSALVAAEVALMVRYAINEANPLLVGHIPAAFKKFAYFEDSPKHFQDKMEPLAPEDIEPLAQAITNNVLTTIYQGTVNSGSVTLNAAKYLAEGIGAKFDAWIIDDAVDFYTMLAETSIGRKLDWDKDDIPLQNIQARSRAPGVWMIANIKNQLLLTTGNLSEASVGYMTQDGDTAGVLAPIIGVRKTRVRALLRWLCEEGTLMGDKPFRMGCLHQVVSQQPTAELRPGEQTDEEDLMPFPILDGIILESLILRRNPCGLFKALKRKFPEVPENDLVKHIKRYYQLFNRNQWKRDRSAPGFHIELDSLDPKTFARFPLLNGGFKRELEELDELVKG